MICRGSRSEDGTERQQHSLMIMMKPKVEGKSQNESSDNSIPDKFPQESFSNFKKEMWHSHPVSHSTGRDFLMPCFPKNDPGPPHFAKRTALSDSIFSSYMTTDQSVLDTKVSFLIKFLKKLFFTII